MLEKNVCLVLFFLFVAFIWSHQNVLRENSLKVLMAVLMSVVYMLFVLAIEQYSIINFFYAYIIFLWGIFLPYKRYIYFVFTCRYKK